MARILLIDDNAQIRRGIEKFLVKSGYEFDSCVNGKEALAQLAVHDYDLVLTDIKMPVMTGLEFLKQMSKRGISVPVIVQTGHASVDSAVEAMKFGAADYLTKPIQLDELAIRIERLLKQKNVENENERLRTELGAKFSFHGIIGSSAAMKTVFDRVKPLASDRDISILLYGETGTGKELFAKAIHHSSPRARKPFVAINCGALPEHLLESELFGHEKGSFTDASDQKTGMFEIANGGTLFLDEVDSMPLDVQVRLLRAIEERTIRRVGGTIDIPLDIRLVCASSRPLEKLVESAEFRADLYFRIAIAPVTLPPLRDRTGDVILLARYFADKKGNARGKDIEISKGVLNLLSSYDWPGNVRELENLFELLAVTNQDGTISNSDLPPVFHAGVSTSKENVHTDTDLKTATKQVVEQFERDFIFSKLKKNHWNISRTAEDIGLSRASLHSKIKDYKLRDAV